MCNTADADSIFGRLQFCESAIFGRSHRIFLTPIFKQKYATSRAISPPLKASLKWFSDFLSSPKSVHYDPPGRGSDFLIFSDASESGLGVVICVPGGGRYSFAAPVPESFFSLLAPGDNAIFILEILGALLAIRVLRDRFARRRKASNVVFLIDNDPALASLIRGSARSDLAGRAIYNFWKVADAAKIVPWLERVSSSANLADAPSRCSHGHTILKFPDY